MSEQGARKIMEARDKDGNTAIQFMGPARSDDALSLCLRILTHQLKLKQPDGDHGGGFFGGAYGYGVDYENDVFLMHHFCWCEKDDCLWCGGSDCQADIAREAHREGCYQDHKRKFERQHGEVLGVYGGVESYHIPYGSRHHKRFDAFLQRLCSEMGLDPEWGLYVHCTCGVDAEWKVKYEACQCDWHLGRGIYRFGAAKSAPNFWHKPSGFQLRWYKYIGRDNEIESEPKGEITLHEMFTEVLASIGAPSLEECAQQIERAEQEEAEAAKRAMEFAFSDEGRKMFQEMEDAGVIKTFGFGKKE